MRTKDEILKDSNDHFRNVPGRDVTIALHRRLTVEVLIDIRDIFADMKKVTLGLYDYFVHKD